MHILHKLTDPTVYHITLHPPVAKSTSSDANIWCPKFFTTAISQRPRHVCYLIQVLFQIFFNLINLFIYLFVFIYLFIYVLGNCLFMYVCMYLFIFHLYRKVRMREKNIS